MVVVGVVVVVALVEMGVRVLLSGSSTNSPGRNRKPSQPPPPHTLRNKTLVGFQGPKKTPSQGFQGLKKNLSQSGHENSPFGGRKN